MYRRPNNKYSFLLLSIVFMLFSCHKKISDSEFQWLNGYWEIERVELYSGEQKNYTLNPVVDYIQLQENKGFRKKMKPNFSGKYETSDDAENFEIDPSQNPVQINYTNGGNNWTEYLISLQKDRFSVRDEMGNVYYYQRFVPMTIE